MTVASANHDGFTEASESGLSAGTDVLDSLPLRMTQDELAAHWRVSPRSLERWRRNKSGPAWLRLAGRILYRREDVVAFEAAHLRRRTD